MSSVFKDPQCFIYSEPGSGKLTLQPEVLQELSTIDKQLNVVSITGLYRTGKSYLLNRLAGKMSGFPLGSTIEAQTKGIWAWCVEHPCRKDEVLLLLDTEGLGDVKKGDDNHDNQIFTIATLISSTLIYNMFGAFDQDALNKLRFIVEIAKNIQVKDGDIETDDSSFDLYFPEFILSMRDFGLELEIDGHEITPDEYLENCLSAQPGDGEQVKAFNEPRLCIRKYFKKRKCFIFDRPVSSRNQLKELDRLSEEDLSPDFVQDTQKFLDYVWKNCTGLSLSNGKPVTGRMFANIVTNYVTKIRNGGVPCIMNALQAMAMIENDRAISAAIEMYKRRMDELVEFPTKTEDDLLTLHVQCKEEASDFFRKERVLDEDNNYLVGLEERLQNEYDDFVAKNQRFSMKVCENALTSLHRSISDKLKNGAYACPGGYQLYKHDKEEIRRRYDATADLGVMKEKAFFVYTSRGQTEEEAVMMSDSKVTELQQKLEREETEKKIAEQKEAITRQMLEQNNAEIQSLKDQMERELSLAAEDHAKQMEAERENFDKIMEQRIKEINRLQEERLDEIREQQEEELQKLRDEQEEREKSRDENAATIKSQFDRTVAVRQDQSGIIPGLSNIKLVEMITSVVQGVSFLANVFSSLWKKK